MRRLRPPRSCSPVALPGAAARDFPRDFLWGTAISAFQTEAGGTPAHADRRSDWWVWSHDPENIAAGHVSGDRVERGPGHWRAIATTRGWPRDRLGANAFRLSIEWSRRLPALDRRRARRRASSTGCRPGRAAAPLRGGAARHPAARHAAVLTLNHFTLPTWLHDPIAARDAFAGVGPDDPPPAVERGGWLDRRTVREFGKYAAWAAWRYGDLVDLWVTLNEPMVVAASGYVNVPGRVRGLVPARRVLLPGGGRVGEQPGRGERASPTTRSTATTGARRSGRCTT